MKAAVLNKPLEIQIVDIPIPEPKDGEIRIKLSKIGICGSDVHLFLGHRLLTNPTIIGHEGFGIIDKIGRGVLGKEIGERVVIEPNFPCSKCKYCASGRGNICINKRVLGINDSGAFAEYITIPERFVWKIPDEISDDNAVIIEPMAVAYSALFTSSAQPGDAIAVIGLGAIGLLVTHLATCLGYKVFVSETNSHKRKLAADMGAKLALVEGNFEEQAQALELIWFENDVISVFECAGSDFTVNLVTSAAPRGSEIILVGLSEKKANFQPLKIVREGIKIIPSIIYNHPFDFKRVIQLISNKIIAPSFIISSSTSLENIQSALELASEGNESKIIVEM